MLADELNAGGYSVPIVLAKAVDVDYDVSDQTFRSAWERVELKAGLITSIKVPPSRRKQIKTKLTIPTKDVSMWRKRALNEFKSMEQLAAAMATNDSLLSNKIKPVNGNARR